MDKNPHEPHLCIEAKRESTYSCPECGAPCKAHDFIELTWRHLNFFQHHCYLSAAPMGDIVNSTCYDEEPILFYSKLFSDQFLYKVNKQKKWKKMALDAMEFIRRFNNTYFPKDL